MWVSFMCQLSSFFSPHWYFFVIILKYRKTWANWRKKKFTLSLRISKYLDFITSIVYAIKHKAHTYILSYKKNELFKLFFYHSFSFSFSWAIYIPSEEIKVSAQTRREFTKPMATAKTEEIQDKKSHIVWHMKYHIFHISSVCVWTQNHNAFFFLVF